MIKAIIFDCYGVLTKSTWQEFWSSLPTPNMREQARVLNRAYDGAVISEEDFSTKLQSLTKRSKSEIQKIFFDEDPSKNTELIDYIRTLKPKYKTAILSNIATSWVEDYLLTDDEKELFDAMVFSFRVGITKPDPEIFKLTAEQLGVSPDECVFIDDIDRYCVAARDGGMQTITYKDFKQMKVELEKLFDEDA